MPLVSLSSSFFGCYLQVYNTKKLFFFYQEDLNIWLLLRLKFPRLLGWLVWFACGRRKCLICGEPETIKGPRYGCNTVGCVYIHCEDCWKDVGFCYACSDVFDREDNNDNNESLMGYIDTGYSE